MMVADSPSGPPALFRQDAVADVVVDPLIDRFDLGFLLRKHWWKFLIGPLLGMMAGYVVYKRQQPLFESTAEILVDPAFEQIIQYENLDGAEETDHGLRSLERAIVANSVLLRVVDKLGLRDEPGFLPEEMAARRDLSDAELVDFLRGGRIKAALLPDTRMIRISVLDPSAERAQRIAEAMTTEFEAFVTDERSIEGREAREKLETQANEARRLALQSEEELKKLRQSNPRFPVEQDHDFVATKLSKAGQELSMAKDERRKLEGQLAILEGLDPGASAVEIIEVAQFRELSHVSELLTALTDSRTRMDVVSKRYLEKHPNYRAAAAEVRRNEEQLQFFARNAVSAVRSKVEAARIRERDLEDELKTAMAELSEVKSISSEFRALQQQAEREWQVHQMLQAKLSESDVSADRATRIGTVVAKPLVPYEKAKPEKLLYLVLGGALGAVPSGLVLLFAVFSGLPFSNVRQLEQRFGLPVIADWSNSRKIRENRKPMRMMSYLAAGQEKAIQVSAPSLNGMGESVARKMAQLSASQGKKTLLMLVRQSQQGVNLETTADPNFSVLTMNPEIVVDMSQFPEGLEQLRESYEIVFIEAGSLNDPDMIDYLSSHADMDVVVVGKDATKKQIIEDRVRKLASRGTSPALVIVEPGAKHRL